MDSCPMSKNNCGNFARNRIGHHRERQKFSIKKQKTSNACHKDGIINNNQDSNADWRDKCTSVHDIYVKALERNHLADVNFLVGDEKVPFSAHRMILALGSPVFQAMFFGGLPEKGPSVSIPDVDPKGFENLLRFLYSGDLKFENEVVAFKTFYAADKYCVVILKNMCESYLTTCNLKPSNVWLFLEGCLYLNSNSLKNRCFSYLKSYTKTALEDSSFLGVSAKTLETFLSIDAVNISEIKLLNHVVLWAECQAYLEPDPVAAFRTSMIPMLKFVRFINMRHQDFVLLIENPKLKDLFSDSDALAILKFIIKPSLCQLPEWCCKKGRITHKKLDSLFCYDENGKKDNYPHIENHCSKRKWEGPGLYTTSFSSTDTDSELEQKNFSGALVSKSRK